MPMTASLNALMGDVYGTSPILRLLLTLLLFADVFSGPALGEEMEEAIFPRETQIPRIEGPAAISCEVSTTNFEHAVLVELSSPASGLSEEELKARLQGRFDSIAEEVLRALFDSALSSFSRRMFVERSGTMLKITSRGEWCLREIPPDY